MIGSGTAVSREQVRAAAVVGGLVLLSLLAWFVLGLVTTDPQPREPEVLGGPAPSAPPPRSGASSAGDGADDQQDAEPAPDDEPPDESSDESSDEPDEPTERVTIDFDGVCTVELDPDEQTSRPRPWQFEECARAPFRLQGAQTRWIVVLDSLAGSDFTESEALTRTSGSQQLLWSTHYPSLNPGLWVVVDGPYDDREAAIEAADRLGGGAYARELSDDDRDRYCVAADGCVGEQRG
jgi:hypothetical protein